MRKGNNFVYNGSNVFLDGWLSLITQLISQRIALRGDAVPLLMHTVIGTTYQLNKWWQQPQIWEITKCYLGGHWTLKRWTQRHVKVCRAFKSLCGSKVSLLWGQSGRRRSTKGNRRERSVRQISADTGLRSEPLQPAEGKSHGAHGVRHDTECSSHSWTV